MRTTEPAPRALISESRRLLGPWRVVFSSLTAATVAFGLLPPLAAVRVLGTTALGTIAAGTYGYSVLGGVMGDFLGATICMIELAIYLAIGADAAHAQLGHLLWLAFVVSLPQAYGWWVRGWKDRPVGTRIAEHVHQPENAWYGIN